MADIQIGQHFFTPEQLQQYTQTAQAVAANPDKKGAFVGGFDNTGAHVALVTKFSDHVEFETAFVWHPTTGEWAAGGQIIASWP